MPELKHVPSAPSTPSGSLPVSFFVPGVPKAQPRARACRRGRHVGVYDPGTADHWKGQVILAARTALHLPEPICWPVQVDILWRFPRPKAHFRAGALRRTAPTWHTGKPDRDNLDKAILDALVDGGILKDDAFVVAGCLAKGFCCPQESPGAFVTLQHPEEPR